MSRPDVNEVAIALGATIRNRRVLLGLSQEAVGCAAGGITYQQIAKYENGSNNMSIFRGMQIAQALKWTLPQLLAVALEGVTTTTDASDRKTLELAKRFARLKPNEREGVTLLVRSLAGAA